MITPETRLYRDSDDGDMYAVKWVNPEGRLKGVIRQSFCIHIDDITETFGEGLYSAACNLGRGEYVEVLLSGKVDDRAGKSEHTGDYEDTKVIERVRRREK